MERTRFGMRLVLATALLCLVAPVGAVAQETSDGLLYGSFGGNAYGSKANAIAGDVAARLGRSAYVTSGCAGTGGEVRSNTVDTVDAGKAAKAQQIFTTAYTNKTATSGIVKHTSKVEGVRLLGGRVTADGVLAVARTTADRTSARSNTRGSKFINLVVDGEPVVSRPAANQKMMLPGLGYFELESVALTGDGVNRSGISVNMLTVVVKENNRFDLPIGAKIVIAHAESRFKRQEPIAVVSGAGFATAGTSQVAEVENRLGRSAAVYLPCEGTNGRVLSNNIEALNITNPGDGKTILSLETGRTTTKGTVSEAQTLALTTSDIVNLNLLDGAITADRVTSLARATVDSSGGAATADGSRFEGLALGGTPLQASPPPNTRVELPGIGYVILNEQKLESGPTSAKARVIMLHVFIDTENSLGLPVGTEIMVASARSAADPF